MKRESRGLKLIPLWYHLKVKKISHDVLRTTQFTSSRPTFKWLKQTNQRCLKEIETSPCHVREKDTQLNNPKKLFNYTEEST